MAISMGLSFAMMADPNNGHQSPILSQIFVIIATLLFLATGAHLVLIEMVLRSFEVISIDQSMLSTEFFWSLIQWSSIIFLGGLMIALPVMTALLITNMAMGVVSRAAPSLNVFAVGFPATLLIGLVTLSILIPSISEGFEGLWLESYQKILIFLGLR
jgi:flagellar biosynthetic protein FliR